MLPPRRQRKRRAATYRAQVPLRISRRRGQVGAVEAKVGPRGRIGRNGAAVCRVPCGRARTRHAFWTVLCVVIVVLLPVIFSVSVLSVCLVLSLRVSDPWEPERLFASVPRAFRAPLLLAQRQVWFPIKTRSARHESGSAGPRTVSRLAGWLSQHGRSRRSTRASSRVLSCMVAWLRGRLCCRAAHCAAVPHLPMRKYSPLSAENAS